MLRESWLLAAREKVGPASPADRDSWLELRCALWPGIEIDAHRREIADVLAAPAQRAALLYVDGGAPIGLIEVSRRSHGAGGDGPVVYVEGLYTHPLRRGEGVAGALVEAAAQWARTRGCATLACHADIDDEQGHLAHAALGFEEIGRVVQFRMTVPAAPIDLRPGGPAGVAAAAEPAPAVAAYADATVQPAPRRAWSVFAHGLLFALGAASFYNTDIWSGDPMRGALLPILDALFVVYAVLFVLLTRYRRRTDARDRHELLYRSPPRDGNGPH